VPRCRAARRGLPWRPIARTALRRLVSAASEMSSEYAIRLLVADTARTPTPRSMLNVPDFTMPSSRLQPSKRACWK
jgi:hypothetical protein